MQVALRHLVFLAVLLSCNEMMAAKLKCHSKQGRPLNFKVSDCPNYKRGCKFIRNTNVTLSVNFLSETDSDYVAVSLNARLMYAGFYLTQPYTDACKTGLDCPIRNGKTYVYNYTQHIPKESPKISAVYFFRIENRKDRGGDIICIAFNGTIV